MDGKRKFELLVKAHDRSHLITHAESNGISWNKADHEGVNWMRACSAIIDYLEDNNFYLEDMNLEEASEMLNLYNRIRDYHKMTMAPHLRSAMAKIHSYNRDNTKSDDDLLKSAHLHLDKYGGEDWRSKVYNLGVINRQIEYLEMRTQSMESSEDGKEEV